MDATFGTPLSDILSARTRDGAYVRFSVSPDWLNGRNAYGGLVAALAACALHDVLGRDRPLRALQVNFLGPLGSGPAEVEVRVLRSGKSISQAEATVRSGGEIACIALAVLGTGRASALTPRLAAMPAAPAPETLFEVPYLPGRMPPFLQHFAARWAEGLPPYSGRVAPSSKIWLQLKGERIDRELLTVVFCDAMPSPAMAEGRAPFFAASLAWSIEFLPAAFEPAAGTPAEGWWRADTELTANAEGFANQLTTLWSPEGQPAAISHQVVAMYA